MDIKLKLIEQLRAEKDHPRWPKDQKLIKIGDKEFVVKFRFGQIINIQPK